MRVIAAMGTHLRGRLPRDAYPRRRRPPFPRLSPRSVRFRREIGRAPRRDRSTSGSKSVVLRTEFGPLPARDRSDSARPTRRRDAHDELEGESRMPHLRTSGEQQPRGSTTDLDTESDRSRAEVRPISTRVSTDLGAEADRSRREFRPISTRKRTDLGAELDRSRRLLL